MAFIVPLIELGELIGEAIVGYEAVSAGTALAATEGAALAATETAVVTEGAAGIVAAPEIAATGTAAGISEVAMADVAEAEVWDPMVHDYALDAYENEYMRIPLEEPDIGIGVEEGYPDPEVQPYEPGYWGPVGEAGYRLLPQEEAVVTESNLLARLRDDPMLRTVITVGAGKAVFVAGFWQFLDPITGAPIYAIAGDDPRVDSIMHALGYTDNARDAGHVLREWFYHLFGYDMPNSSSAEGSTSPVQESVRRRPNRNFPLPNQPLTENSEPYKMPSRKRARTNYVMAGPSAVPGAVSSRPMFVVKKAGKRARRVMTINRSLGRILNLQLQYNVAGSMEFGVSGAYALGASGGSVTAAGYQWGNDCFGLSFKLSDFPEYTDLTNAFDQFRIKSALVTFIPSRESSPANTGASLPVMVACEDRDDINLSGLTTEKLASKQGMKYFRLEDPFTVKCRPTPWTYETGGVAKSKVLGGWIPCTNNQTQHFGLKLAPIKGSFTQALAGTPQVYTCTVMIRINVECKHQD
jgi:hypothetical protein